MDQTTTTANCPSCFIYTITSSVGTFICTAILEAIVFIVVSKVIQRYYCNETRSTLYILTLRLVY